MAMGSWKGHLTFVRTLVQIWKTPSEASELYQRANVEFLKLSKDPVIFGEIISGDFLQSAMAAIGMPQFANGPLFTSFIAVPGK